MNYESVICLYTVQYPSLIVNIDAQSIYFKWAIQLLIELFFWY